MKATFDTSSYYIGSGGASLVVERSSKAESEQVAVAFREQLRLDVGAIPGVTSFGTPLRKYGQPPSKWMQLEVDPGLATDLAARETFIWRLIEVVRASGARFAPLPVVDWLTAPYRAGHSVRARDELMRYGPDAARFERLQALRLPSIGPWLDGREKVRDQGAFVAFHSLDAGSQALLRQAVRDGQVWPIAPCADGCHPSWPSTLLPALLAAGWLVPVNSQGNPYGYGRSGGYARGPALARLNQAAGEMMAD